MSQVHIAFQSEPSLRFDNWLCSQHVLTTPASTQCQRAPFSLLEPSDEGAKHPLSEEGRDECGPKPSENRGGALGHHHDIGFEGGGEGRGIRWCTLSQTDGGVSWGRRRRHLVGEVGDVVVTLQRLARGIGDLIRGRIETDRPTPFFSTMYDEGGGYGALQVAWKVEERGWRLRTRHGRKQHRPLDQGPTARAEQARTPRDKLLVKAQQAEDLRHRGRGHGCME
mmetsp:Transcript_75617/g.177532  ORF Transcript_75617/g.177532 Transcript_75617/m.177532 type:complete len:224 (+) Transcript_75617:57-728(+)|eukprot:CAMPEP_0175854238 /NCGR_PEP_ID=MMETSP0107_2-20121207/27254_1 /TAXON_ID=195067 ORGANISM="Goniomonas pacifica, Strain CCMP1869" /NCGR_SAMPLE_ID=MMETSP0107_2 /ASSEMBLY_ACC=CAM_ASM_000203 /LENGTH=223 /DNA_ID=CAMNT_0017170055 /DNA_START=57 /DNA_END=728 /DNA_ORIENTATION=+